MQRMQGIMYLSAVGIETYIEEQLAFEFMMSSEQPLATTTNQPGSSVGKQVRQHITYRSFSLSRPFKAPQLDPPGLLDIQVRAHQSKLSLAILYLSLRLGTSIS